MRAMSFVACVSLAASMASGEIRYYDSSANPFAIIPEFDPFGLSQTYFDITQSPGDQGQRNSRSIATGEFGGGSELYYGIWLDSLPNGPSDVEVLSGFALVTEPDSHEPEFDVGFVYRTSLQTGTPVEGHTNELPTFDGGPILNEFPLVYLSSWDHSYSASGLFGVRLTLPTGVHYGWFELTRVQFPPEISFGIYFAVSRWAWNDTPGGGILAGQVPAPGAMMVLCVGGLVATRRRR